MIETLSPRPVETTPQRLRAKDLEPFVGGTVDVAEHEWTHILALWAIPSSVKEANTIPSGPQLGVTIPAGDLTPRQMQIAAMASSEHAGNGSDKQKAYVLQYFGGMPMEQAESIAKSIVKSYRKDVLHAASVYLAFYRTANESQLRQFLRWAEEDVTQSEQYEKYHLPIWSDELEEKQQVGEKEQVNQHPEFQIPERIAQIRYEGKAMSRLLLEDGREKLLCGLCYGLDSHKEGCANAPERQDFKEYVIFSASNHTDFFSPN